MCVFDAHTCNGTVVTGETTQHLQCSNIEQVNGLTAIQVQTVHMQGGCESWCTTMQVWTAWMLTLSFDVDNSQLPFGLHRVTCTGPLWPCNVLKQSPERGSHSFTMQSLLPDAIKLFVGCHSQFFTPQLWPVVPRPRAPPA